MANILTTKEIEPKNLADLIGIKEIGLNGN